jgi:hypothetical protein
MPLADWKEWEELHPESKVLSRNTGSTRPDGADPNGIYYINSKVLFLDSTQNDRLGINKIIVTMKINPFRKSSGNTKKSHSRRGAS